MKLASAVKQKQWMSGSVKLFFIWFSILLKIISIELQSKKHLWKAPADSCKCTAGTHLHAAIRGQKQALIVIVQSSVVWDLTVYFV